MPGYRQIAAALAEVENHGRYLSLRCGQHFTQRLFTMGRGSGPNQMIGRLKDPATRAFERNLN
jgi:hypothetical protein